MQGNKRAYFSKGIIPVERMDKELSTPTTVKFNALSGFVVYGWRRGSDYLYIGFSACLYNRLVNHHVIGRLAKVEHDDELDIWQCSTMHEARATERYLVTKLNPPFNASIKLGDKRSKKRLVRRSDGKLPSYKA